MSELIDAINRSLKNRGYELENATETTSGNTTTIRALIGGQGVRIEHKRGQRPREYSNTIWVYSDQTGDTVGRGNGGSDMRDAVMMYQWNGAILDLGLPLTS